MYLKKKQQKKLQDNHNLELKIGKILNVCIINNLYISTSSDHCYYWSSRLLQTILLYSILLQTILLQTILQQTILQQSILPQSGRESIANGTTESVVQVLLPGRQQSVQQIDGQQNLLRFLLLLLLFEKVVKQFFIELGY